MTTAQQIYDNLCFLANRPQWWPQGWIITQDALGVRQLNIGLSMVWSGSATGAEIFIEGDWVGHLDLLAFHAKEKSLANPA